MRSEHLLRRRWDTVGTGGKSFRVVNVHRSEAAPGERKEAEGPKPGAWSSEKPLKDSPKNSPKDSLKDLKGCMGWQDSGKD